MARARPTQQERGPRRIGWTKTREKMFFEELARTGSVVGASLAVGFESTSSAYKRYPKNAAFRAKWAKALADAEKRLDQAMLARALKAAEEGGVEGDLAKGPVTFKDALAFINRAAGKRARAPARVPDADAARAQLLKQVLALKRAHERREGRDQ